MVDTGLHDGVDIDAIFPASTLHQMKIWNAIMNNPPPLINGTMPPPKKQSVSTLTSTSVTSINDIVRSLQNSKHEKIK